MLQISAPWLSCLLVAAVQLLVVLLAATHHNPSRGLARL